MQTNKTSIQKKEEASKRIEKLDLNNNKNPQQKPLIRKRGKIVHDDGFEHRTSKETSV